MKSMCVSPAPCIPILQRAPAAADAHHPSCGGARGRDVNGAVATADGERDAVRSLRARVRVCERVSV